MTTLTDEQIDEVVQKRFGNMNVKFKLHFRHAVRDCLSASIADTAVLQDLGYELGCPAGIKTIDWLRVMVRKAQRAEVSSIADTAGAKEAEASFNDFADRYNHESNEWLDMDVQTFYLEGYKAALAAPPAPSVADAAGASEDARHAARWRHLRNCGVIVDFTHAGPWKFTDDADAAVDKLIARSAAINAASASKTTERKKLCTGSHIMCEGREYCLGHPSCSELAAKESGND